MNSGVDLFHFDSDEDVFCVYWPRLHPMTLMLLSQIDSGRPVPMKKRWRMYSEHFAGKIKILKKLTYTFVSNNDGYFARVDHSNRDYQ